MKNKTETVMRFDQNTWVEIPVTQLIENDLIYYKGQLIEVTEPPSVIKSEAEHGIPTADPDPTIPDFCLS